jgi:diaminopimelate decarboxylase
LNEKGHSEISRWKDWLVCLKVIPMHLTADQAFKSHLFGMNEEQLIQLVYPSNTKRLQLFKCHSNSQDREAQDFFTLIEDTAKLRTEMESWERGIKITWI